MTITAEHAIDTLAQEKRRHENEQTLNYFADLKAQSDGRYAPTISKAVIKLAYDLLPWLLLQPEVSMTADGAIQLDFTEYDNFEIELLLRDGVVDFWLVQPESLDVTATLINKSNSPVLVSERFNALINMARA